MSLLKQIWLFWGGGRVTGIHSKITSYRKRHFGCVECIEPVKSYSDARDDDGGERGGEER